MSIDVVLSNQLTDQTPYRTACQVPGPLHIDHTRPCVVPRPRKRGLARSFPTNKFPRGRCDQAVGCASPCGVPGRSTTAGDGDHGAPSSVTTEPLHLSKNEGTQCAPDVGKPGTCYRRRLISTHVDVLAEA